MRSSGLRGGAGCWAVAVVACLATGDCGAVLDAVEDVVDEADDEVRPDDVEDGAPGVTGNPVVALMPGGVRGSGRGVALCADGNTAALGVAAERTALHIGREKSRRACA